MSNIVLIILLFILLIILLATILAILRASKLHRSKSGSAEPVPLPEQCPSGNYRFQKVIDTPEFTNFLQYLGRRFNANKNKEIYRGKSDEEIFALLRRFAGAQIENKFKADYKDQTAAVAYNVRKMLAGAQNEHKIEQILDIGTESDDFLRSFEDVFGGAKCHGINIREGFPHYWELPKGVTIYDGVNIPFEDRKFDLVTISSVLHHIRDAQLAKFVAEICRVAKHYIYVKDIDILTKVNAIFNDLQHEVYEGGIIGAKERSFASCAMTYEKLVQYMGKNGFHVAGVIRQNNFINGFFALFERKNKVSGGDRPEPSLGETCPNDNYRFRQVYDYPQFDSFLHYLRARFGIKLPKKAYKGKSDTAIFAMLRKHARKDVGQFVESEYLRFLRAGAKSVKAMVDKAAPGAQIDSILDIGTENEQYLDMVDEVFGGQSKGVNIDVGFQHYSKGRKPRIIIYDGIHMPYKDRQFDLVTISAVLHHIKDVDLRPFVHEMCRVANKYIYVKDVDLQTMVQAILYDLQHELYEGGIVGTRRSFTSCAMTLQKLVDYAQEAGFKIVTKVDQKNFNNGFYCLLKRF